LFADANKFVNKLNDWFVLNKLSISIDKTCYTVFGSKITDNINITINGVNIKKVPYCKYLGLIIESELKWNDHIDFVYNKLLKYVGIFYKLRSKLPIQCLRNIYYAFVHPHLLFGIELYGNACASYLDRLTKLNNKLLRILQNKPLKFPVAELYQNYHTFSLLSLHSYQIPFVTL
jgi:hypothetical protein